MIISIYTDGASRGNPGESASGFSAFDSKGKLLLKKIYYNGIKTNNYAEYAALLHALVDIGKKFGYEHEITLYSDSQLIVMQLNGKYKIKDFTLKGLYRAVVEEASKFKSCKFVNVRRENVYIAQVDKALNIFLDKLMLKRKGNL